MFHRGGGIFRSIWAAFAQQTPKTHKRHQLLSIATKAVAQRLLHTLLYLFLRHAPVRAKSYPRGKEHYSAGRLEAALLPPLRAVPKNGPPVGVVAAAPRGHGAKFGIGFRFGFVGSSLVRKIGERRASSRLVRARRGG